MNEANFTVGKRIIVHGSVTLKDADKTEARVRLLLVLCIFRVGDHAWRGGGPITVVSRARLSGERRKGNFPAYAWSARLQLRLPRTFPGDRFFGGHIDGVRPTRILK